MSDGLQGKQLVKYWAAILSNVHGLIYVPIHDILILCAKPQTKAHADVSSGDRGQN